MSLIATDVFYRDDGTALAAAVAFERWEDSAPSHAWLHEVPRVAPYVPGRFFERELPCLLQLLAASPVPVDLVVVDGHVWLQVERPGLGHHLWEALGRRVPVIGVAKRAFHQGAALPVRRGNSESPLHVSAVGVDAAQAAADIARMHGAYRLPTLLKRVDRLGRDGSADDVVLEHGGGGHLHGVEDPVVQDPHLVGTLAASPDVDSVDERGEAE